VEPKGQTTEELEAINIIMNNIIQKSTNQILFHAIQEREKDIQNMMVRSVGNMGYITAITKKT